MSLNLANGQLAATSGTLLGLAPPDIRRTYVSVKLYNSSGASTETVILTVAVAGGAARGLVRIDLAPYETLQVDNLALDDADILAGYASDAATVDYVVSQGNGGEFNVQSLDVNGAAKQVSSGVSGNQSIGGALTVTSTSASALTVGANGATNPVIKINANTASVATGLHITGAAAAGGLAVAVISSGADEALTINSKGTGTIGIGTVSTGAVTLGAATGITGAATVTSTSASALTVGANGATNPVLKVNANTGSVATGLSVTGAAAAAGLAVAVISSAADEALTLDAKGTGTIGIGTVSTGAVALGAATGVTGALTVTSAGASAFAVGRLGATTPALLVDASTGVSVTGFKVAAGASGGGLALSLTGGAAAENLTLDAKGSGTLTLQGTATGAVALGAATGVTGALTVTSAGAAALAVGRQGATSPALLVDASAATSVTGLSVASAAAGAGLALALVGGNAAENLTLDAKGAGTIGIGTVSTGAITLGAVSTISAAMTFADTIGLGIGTGNDIVLTWDGTDLDITQATPDSSIKWGVDGAGIDQVWYGDTPSTSMTWDQSADSLIFTGAARIRFTGTTGQPEIHLTDDIADALSIKVASGLDIVSIATTNNLESVNWGIDGLGVDHIFYGDTALANMTWDQSADRLIFNGAASVQGMRRSSATAAAITGATTLVLADSGGVFTVSQAGAYDIDLPSPTTGPGLEFVFSLTAPAANTVTITVDGGAATFVGTIVNDVTSVLPATGNTLTFVSGTAILGDTIIIRSIATNLYHVQAVSSAAGGITIA